jgi:hypothetical protein
MQNSMSYVCRPVPFHTTRSEHCDGYVCGYWLKISLYSFEPFPCDVICETDVALYSFLVFMWLR